MINLVQEYSLYVNDLKNLIAKSPYKTAFIQEEIGVPKATFYRKLKEKSFTIDEVLQITKLLFPKEAYKNELMQELKQANEDFEQGRVETHESVMNNLRKKYITK